MHLIIETEQGFNMSYHYSKNELLSMRELVLKGGRKMIQGECLEVERGYLTHYKKGEYSGASYTMPLDGIVENIDALLRTVKE